MKILIRFGLVYQYHRVFLAFISSFITVSVNCSSPIKYMIHSAKAVVAIDKLMIALSSIYAYAKAIRNYNANKTLTLNWSLALIFIISICYVNMNMFARFD